MTFKQLEENKNYEYTQIWGLKNKFKVLHKNTNSVMIKGFNCSRHEMYLSNEFDIFFKDLGVKCIQ